MPYKKLTLRRRIYYFFRYEIPFLIPSYIMLREVHEYPRWRGVRHARIHLNCTLCMDDIYAHFD